MSKITNKNIDNQNFFPLGDTICPQMSLNVRT
jgi:hypothetical protein